MEIYNNPHSVDLFLCQELKIFTLLIERETNLCKPSLNSLTKIKRSNIIILKKFKSNGIQQLQLLKYFIFRKKLTQVHQKKYYCNLRRLNKSVTIIDLVGGKLEDIIESTGFIKYVEEMHNNLVRNK